MYLDLCGPLPSKNAKTANILITTALAGIMNDLSVLITNFAEPDEKQRDSYSNLVYKYLVCKDWVYMDNKKEYMEQSFQVESNFWETYPKQIRQHFSHYYGEFVSMFIIDLLGIYLPIIDFSI